MTRVSDDSNGELEELKIDRQRSALMGRGERQSGGGRTGSNAEPRSRVRDVVLGIIGVLFTMAFGAVANNLWQLNLTIRDVLAENRMTKDTLSDHEMRIRAGERFQSTWEGRNMRGGPEPKEASRGR